MDTQQTPTTLDDVRLAILRQHTQLAQLIDELEGHAQVLLAKGGESNALKGALELLCTRFTKHLEYEESHLTKWLPKGPADPARALLGDHDDQRSRLNGLLHDREVFGDPRTLAREALTLVHLLRRDMADEESKLRALR